MMPVIASEAKQSLEFSSKSTDCFGKKRRAMTEFILSLHSPLKSSLSSSSLETVNNFSENHIVFIVLPE